MANPAEQELRELVEERVAAVAAKDPEPLAARLHPDLIQFNAVPPLQMRGSDPVSDQTRAWFDAYAKRLPDLATTLAAPHQ
jgi:ketosteroid isomerase-like protein